ncbi:tyrosine transporter TyrP, partial [Klebsiella pneumoniae]|nr:tyrosine transporter TyrP [Klebsiella pneumoniae]
RREHPQATWRVAGGAPTRWLDLRSGIRIVAIQFSIAAGLLPAGG